MATPKEIKERLSTALYWIDSINGFAGWDGKRWRHYVTGQYIALTWDDISTLGSCLGL